MRGKKRKIPKKLPDENKKGGKDTNMSKGRREEGERKKRCLTRKEAASISGSSKKRTFQWETISHRIPPIKKSF